MNMYARSNFGLSLTKSLPCASSLSAPCTSRGIQCCTACSRYAGCWDCPAHPERNLKERMKRPFIRVLYRIPTVLVSRLQSGVVARVQALPLVILGSSQGFLQPSAEIIYYAVTYNIYIYIYIYIYYIYIYIYLFVYV